MILYVYINIAPIEYIVLLLDIIYKGIASDIEYNSSTITVLCYISLQH